MGKIRVVKLKIVEKAGSQPRLEADPESLGADFGDVVHWEIDPPNDQVEFAVDFGAAGRSPFIWMNKKSDLGKIHKNRILHDPNHSGAARFSYNIAAVSRKLGLIFADPDIQVPKPGHRS